MMTSNEDPPPTEDNLNPSPEADISDALEPGSEEEDDCEGYCKSFSCNIKHLAYRKILRWKKSSI